MQKQHRRCSAAVEKCVAAIVERRFAGGIKLRGNQSLAERGVERVYAWFADFGATETLQAFGEEVITAFEAPARD